MTPRIGGKGSMGGAMRRVVIPPGSDAQRREWRGQGVEGPPAPPRFRPRPIRRGSSPASPEQGRERAGGIEHRQHPIQPPPRTAGARSGLCTAAKTRVVMRASISCRLSVLLTRGWRTITTTAYPPWAEAWREALRLRPSCLISSELQGTEDPLARPLGYRSATAAAAGSAAGFAAP